MYKAYISIIEAKIRNKFRKIGTVIYNVNI